MEYTGQTWEVVLPSKAKVTIRETNGDDDSIISKMSLAREDKNIFAFLSGIIVEPKTTATQVSQWLVNDIFYLLFKQRILNLGTELKFEHEDDSVTPSNKQEYEENLALIDGDLSDPDYTPKPNQVPLYPTTDPYLELELSSGQKFRIKRMTGEMQNKLTSKPTGEHDKNIILTAREISIYENGQWLLLTRFNKISSRQMAVLRTWVNKVEPAFSPVVEFKNEHTGNSFSLPLFAIPTFYFPEGTI